MNRLALIVASVTVSLLLTCASAMAAAQVANPAYKHWAQFKVGSSAELTSSMQMKGQDAPPMGMPSTKITRKLVELTAEKAVVETSTTMNMGGQIRSMPARRQDIPAMVDADKVDETGMPQDPRGGQKTDVKKGEGEVTVMEKTLKCQWFEFTMKQGDMSMKGKVWISSEMPGGVVQSEMHMDQMDMSQKLTAFEVAK